MDNTKHAIELFLCSWHEKKILSHELWQKWKNPLLNISFSRTCWLAPDLYKYVNPDQQKIAFTHRK